MEHVQYTKRPPTANTFHIVRKVRSVVEPNCLNHPLGAASEYRGGGARYRWPNTARRAKYARRADHPTTDAHCLHPPPKPVRINPDDSGCHGCAARARVFSIAVKAMSLYCSNKCAVLPPGGAQASSTRCPARISINCALNCAPASCTETAPLANSGKAVTAQGVSSNKACGDKPTVGCRDRRR